VLHLLVYAVRETSFVCMVDNVLIPSLFLSCIF